MTDYFSSLEQTIRDCPAVITSSLLFDQRSRHIGFIKGALTFADSSQLYFKEFVDTSPAPIKYKYGYHYQKSDGRLIFRYDNFTHSPNNPVHHKHLPSSNNLISLSSAPSLEGVLKEIILSIPISRHLR